MPSFGVCAVLIYRWIPKHHEKTVTTGDGYGRRLLEGWRFLRKDKLMMPLVLMIAVTNLLDAAVGAVLLPVWIKDHGFGPGEEAAPPLLDAPAAVIARAAINELDDGRVGGAHGGDHTGSAAVMEPSSSVSTDRRSGVLCGGFPGSGPP